MKERETEGVKRDWKSTMTQRLYVWLHCRRPHEYKERTYGCKKDRLKEYKRDWKSEREIENLCSETTWVQSMTERKRGEIERDWMRICMFDYIVGRD